MQNSFKNWVQLYEAEKFPFSLIKSGLYIFSGQSIEGNWKGIFEDTFEGKRHAQDMLYFHTLWWLHAGQLIIILKFYIVFHTCFILHKMLYSHFVVVILGQVLMFVFCSQVCYACHVLTLCFWFVSQEKAYWKQAWRISVILNRHEIYNCKAD